MTQSPSADQLKAAADQAMMRGDPRGAAALLDQAVRVRHDDPVLWMSLAACRRGVGDLPAALEAIEGALRVDPRLFAALLMKASIIEALGDLRAAGAAYGVALTQAPPRDLGLGTSMKQALAHGREVHAQYQSGLEEALRAGVADARSQCRGGEARRADAFIEILAGKRRIYHQAPVQFHYPGLPEIEFLEREDTPWIEAFEAFTPAVLAELEAVVEAGSGEFTPYIDYPPGVPLDQWAELNHSRRWSAFHLLRDGHRVETNCALCPQTLAAAATIPQPHAPGRSPVAMFSVLKPRTRIPPHVGVSNTRLVVHLPLILPEGCGFRVGGDTRPWRLGEAWVFDDTIEHEAWNDSDDPRTILICDTWNPRLSETERVLITQVMAALDGFGGLAPSSGDL